MKTNCIGREEVNVKFMEEILMLKVNNLNVQNITSVGFRVVKIIFGFKILFCLWSIEIKLEKITFFYKQLDPFPG